MRHGYRVLFALHASGEARRVPQLWLASQASATGGQVRQWLWLHACVAQLAVKDYRPEAKIFRFQPVPTAASFVCIRLFRCVAGGVQIQRSTSKSQSILEQLRQRAVLWFHAHAET